MELFWQLVFLCPTLFVAGIIDGISGGGGMIALPAYMIAGLPVTIAYGCNKLQSCLGTCASLGRYAKGGFFDLKAAGPAALMAAGGSWLATQLMLILDDGTKKMVIVDAMAFVIGLTILSGCIKIDAFDRKRIDFSVKNLIICMCIGFCMGIYDGLFGPGGGTIAILLFALILKLDLRVGGGNGKLIVVVANLASVIAYMMRGKVLYAIALPCAAFNIAGSYLGASVAAKKGAGFVKYISWAVMGMVLIWAIVNLLE